MDSNPPLDLIQMACQGDAAAIQEVLQQYHPSIVHFARRYCAASDLEDAVQETLWTVYQKIGTLRTPQAFISWTFQIVRHHCYRYLSLNRQSTEAMDQLTYLESVGEQDVLYQELKQDIVQALAKLPVAYRQIVILRDIEGYTAPEVAEMLNITVETVKSRLHRGRNELREMLAHWG